MRLVPGEARHSIRLPDSEDSDRAETTAETTDYIEIMKGDKSG